MAARTATSWHGSLVLAARSTYRTTGRHYTVHIILCHVKFGRIYWINKQEAAPAAEQQYRAEKNSHDCIQIELCDVDVYIISPKSGALAQTSSVYLYYVHACL